MRSSGRELHGGSEARPGPPRPIECAPTIQIARERFGSPAASRRGHERVLAVMLLHVAPRAFLAVTSAEHVAPALLDAQFVGVDGAFRVDTDPRPLAVDDAEVTIQAPAGFCARQRNALVVHDRTPRRGGPLSHIPGRVPARAAAIRWRR